MIPSLFVSLKVLAADIPLLLFLGTSIGWILAKKNFRGKNLVYNLIILPIALPPSVVGLYLLMALGRIPYLKEANILFSFTAAVIAPLFPALPIMIQAAKSGFSAVDEKLEAAARTLGDSEFKVFRRVTFPLAKPCLLYTSPSPRD